MNIVELRNLQIEIDLESFKDEYKEKNFAFFSLLDKAITDSSITVYRALTDNEYYNLIVVKNNDIYNALPEPLFLKHISIEQLENKINIEEIEREEIDKIIKSQRENSYMYLKNKEDKARLVLKLTKLTNGKITKEDIEEIVNNIDITEFKIKVIEDAKDFASSITLGNWELGWSLDEVLWNKIFWVDVKQIDDNYIIDNGQFKFGFYDNDELIETSDFNINKKYAVLLKTVKCFQNDPNTEQEYELVVYLPSNNSYKIDKEIQYVLDNFNIE